MSASDEAQDEEPKGTHAPTATNTAAAAHARRAQEERDTRRGDRGATTTGNSHPAAPPRTSSRLNEHNNSQHNYFTTHQTATTLATEGYRYRCSAIATAPCCSHATTYNPPPSWTRAQPRQAERNLRS